MDKVSPLTQSIGVKITIQRQVIPARTIETLPDILKHVRDHNKTGKHLTQGEVAKILKVPPITYRSWENGLRKPSASAVADLSKFVRSHIGENAKLIEAASSPETQKVAHKQLVGRGKKPSLVAGTFSDDKAKSATSKKKLADLNAKITAAVKGKEKTAKAPAKKTAAKKAK